MPWNKDKRSGVASRRLKILKYVHGMCERYYTEEIGLVKKKKPRNCTLILQLPQRLKKLNLHNITGKTRKYTVIYVELQQNRQ